MHLEQKYVKQFLIFIKAPAYGRTQAGGRSLTVVKMDKD
mgnify:CR=1 FL=1